MTNTNFGYSAWLAPKSIAFRAIVSGPDVFATRECEYLLCELLSGSGEDFSVRLKLNPTLPAEGYTIKGGSGTVIIEGCCASGLLYGVYAFALRLMRSEDPASMDVRDAPRVNARILNHWDNGDGSVERGYSGKSLFWHYGRFGYDLARLTDYARLLASVGINMISVNNVNVRQNTAKLLTDKGLDRLVRVADVFRPFGIRLIVSVHFDSPVWLGGCETSDPASQQVIDFWADTAARVYARVPDMAGFLVKADSEFQSGPGGFGHTQDIGANTIARALAPHGGTLYWRCFIYNCLQDWRDTVTDRPKAAYDTFMPLDGRFDKNVVLQIKHGPSDFQVREPNSPLLGAMNSTRSALEFQIAQEYTGHQRDLYAWAVQWEEIFAQPFDEAQNMRDLIGCGKKIEAVVAVSNTGDDSNWCGHYMAQANLYAFGRMAWNPALTARDVTSEWVLLAFGQHPEVSDSICKMLLESRRAYEHYTTPLGLNWMVNVHTHYGPSPEGYEFAKWGTYHRADTKAIGIDRTSSGTNFVSQYQSYVRDMYADIKTCPQDYLLFFHRLPYDFILSCGRTLLQYVYDTHFEGVEAVEGFIKTWESLEDRIPADVYAHVCERFEMQLQNAREWRDVINTYFYRKTGIADTHGRVIHP